MTIKKQEERSLLPWEVTWVASSVLDQKESCSKIQPSSVQAPLRKSGENPITAQHHQMATAILHLGHLKALPPIGQMQKRLKTNRKTYVSLQIIHKVNPSTHKLQQSLRLILFIDLESFDLL